MITEKLEGIASGFKNKFGRAADYVNNPRNATKQMAQRKQPPAKALNVKKPKIGKVGSVDTAFYTKVSAGQNSKLRQGDSIADISAKLLSFIKKNEEDKKLHFELMRDFDKENIQEDERRHKELMDAFKKPKKKEKEERVETKKEVEKKAEETTKETKKADKAATEVKKETQAVPEKKAPEVAKPVEVPKKVEAPKAKPVVEAKPSVTAKPVEPAPAAPQVPKPTVTVPKPSIPSGVSTAAKVVTAVVTGALAGKEALAENISKYESKGAGGYNAYNKGTIGNKMIGADKPIDFSKITISEFLRRGALKPGNPDRLFAVGRYQIIPTTMEGLVKKLKLDPDKTYLDPETQDSLFSNGLVGVIRKKVDDYIKGLSDDKNAAILELAKEFASVGVPFDMMVGKKQLKKGDSYYSGVGGNKAHNSPEEVGAALDADRMKKLGTTKPALAENVSKYETGQKIAQSSVENKELKTAQGNTVIIDNTSTTIASGGGGNQQQVIKVGSSSDLPIHQQG